MLFQDLKKYCLPDSPGVYFFLGRGGKVLYIGKATSLRDRVRSYFNGDILASRGPLIGKMLDEARGLRFVKTDSVLEALILEASLIKKHQPKYNTKEKDDKSFNYVVITHEDYPRVLTVRERQLHTKDTPKWQAIFGPFANAISLKSALRIVRKIFPFRDKCAPASGTPCFDRQIGLCPGVCDGAISVRNYHKTIVHIKKFFTGRKRTLLASLSKEMHDLAARQKFEEAAEMKRIIFALRHINDLALIGSDGAVEKPTIRIEAADISHISGQFTAGVSVAVEHGMSVKSAYRKYRIRTAHAADDAAAIYEVTRRRFAYVEWGRPDIWVVDGGVIQKRAAERALNELGVSVAVASVVKDAHHKPRVILGAKFLAKQYGKDILLANSESHRFAVAYHRKLRSF